jgi:RNA polymerase primary sigma factor
MQTTLDYDESLSLYYHSIKKIRLLSEDEEKMLGTRALKGDTSARKRIVEANLRLVVRIARTMWKPGLSLVDLVQDGNIGLMKAAEKFDPGRNVRFSTYAVWWIRQSITRSLINTGRTIRLPHRKEEMLKKLQATTSILSQRLQSPPTSGQLSEALGISVSSVDKLRGYSENVGKLETISDQDSVNLLDMYEDYTFAPETVFQAAVLKEQTIRLLDVLQVNEKKVICERFELSGKAKKSLKQVGREMGLSPETVRHLEKKAIGKLRGEASKGYLCMTA